MKKKFPKEIVVSVEQEGSSDEYLQVNNSCDGAAEIGVKKKAAIYTLKQQITIESVAKVSNVR